MTQFGGLAITPDGLEIYAGVALDDELKSHAIISAQTTDGRGQYKVLVATEHHPNGMAADWDHNILYFTDEGNHIAWLLVSLTLQAASSCFDFFLFLLVRPQ